MRWVSLPCPRWGGCSVAAAATCLSLVGATAVLTWADCLSHTGCFFFCTDALSSLNSCCVVCHAARSLTPRQSDPPPCTYDPLLSLRPCCCLSLWRRSAEERAANIEKVQKKMPKRVKRKRPVRTEDGMEVRLLTTPECMGGEGGGNGPAYLARVLLTVCAPQHCGGPFLI